jgi:hypothetical protein
VKPNRLVTAYQLVEGTYPNSFNIKVKIKKSEESIQLYRLTLNILLQAVLLQANVKKIYSLEW